MPKFNIVLYAVMHWRRNWPFKFRRAMVNHAWVGTSEYSCVSITYTIYRCDILMIHIISIFANISNWASCYFFVSMFSYVISYSADDHNNHWSCNNQYWANNWIIIMAVKIIYSWNRFSLKSKPESFSWKKVRITATTIE